ncbi:MAG: cyclic nucleotide-binding domain-containing protein [candidate division KSB1 bacterium]|nr:cyclic nucleotide-binding domain-containing protein [candidate division KSB1 bacterium]
MARKKEPKAGPGVEQLARFPILAGLTDEQLQRVWGILELRDCPAGEVIVQEGETGDALFLVLHGEVEVSKTLTLMVGRGNVDTRDKALDRMSAAQAPFFGEMALLDSHHQRTATVRTLTSCKLGVLRRAQCIALCEQDPKLGFLLMRNIASALATRLDKANRDILKLTTAFSLALQE